MDAVGDFSKPWLPRWLMALRGLTPVEQVIGLWLVVQANCDGEVGVVDWQRLVDDSGVSIHTAKRRLLDGQLILSGLVHRQSRQEGGVRLPTLFTLNVNCTHSEEAVSGAVRSPQVH